MEGHTRASVRSTHACLSLSFFSHPTHSQREQRDRLQPIKKDVTPRKEVTHTHTHTHSHTFGHTHAARCVRLHFRNSEGGGEVRNALHPPHTSFLL
jgi:hypothetical protein